MKNITVFISSFLVRGQRWQLAVLVALFFVAGCTVELYPPVQEVSNLPDGGKVDVLPDTIPDEFAFGPRIFWSQIVASDSAYSIAVTDANNKGRWLDSLRWVPAGPFVTVNGDTLSTRAYARDNSGVTGDNQVLIYNGSGSLTIESGNTVDMSDLLDNTDDQTIDTFSLSTTTLSLSLEGDGEAAQTVDLLSLTTNETITLSGDVTGSGTTAITTTIATGAVGPDELASTAVTPGSYTAADITVDADGRITSAANGSGGGGGDNLGNHIMTQNLQTNGNWISGDGDNEGISIDADGEIHASNSINSNTGDYFRPSSTGVGICSGATITGAAVSSQVIEITLPSAIFSSSMGGVFNASFQVTILSTWNTRELLVNVAGSTAPVISSNSLDNYVISLDGLDLTNYEWRIGHNGTDLKIWLGSLTGAKFTGQVVISNISIFTNAAGFTADDICNDWEIAAESTAYDTVLKTGKIGSVYNPLIRQYEIYQGYLGTLSMSGVVFARRSISANNSSEITIPVTANMVSDVIVTMKLGISESSNSDPIQYGTLRSRLNMATKAWSNASFEWDDPGYINQTFELRLGDDGTNLKIWVWPIGSTKSVTSGIIIKDIVMSKYGTSTPPFNDFVDFTAGLNWTFVNESTSYDNVDVTLGPYPGLGVNTNTPSYILDINSTDAVRLPVGTTAQRPTGANGLIRFSSTNNKLEAYYNAQWNSLASEGIEDDGSASDTTDGSGDITVSHTLGSAGITVTATTTGTTFYHVQVHSKTTTTFKIRFFDAAGAAVTSTAVTADWIAKLQ